MTQAIPDHVEIEFACNNRTRRVHVLPYVPSEDEGGPKSVTMSFGEGLAAMAATPIRTLCGQKLRIGMAGSGTMASPGDFTDIFEDDDLCIACVRMLGDQSWRAFEHTRPSDLEDD
jgi:hypothetical protein